MKMVLFLLSFIASQLFAQIVLNNQFKGGNEPSMVINPKNNAQIVLAFNNHHVFRSKDSGKTFRRVEVSSKYGFYGDPVLVNDEFGRVYLVHLAKNKTLKWPESFDRIVFQSFGFKTKKVKASVGVGYQVGKMQDKPWLFVQKPANTKSNQMIHLTWTCFDKYNSRAKGDSTRIMHAYSADNGKSFSTPQIISKTSGIAVDGDSAMEGATVCMDRKIGHVYALWSGMNQLWFAKSINGTKWDTPQSIGNHENGWEISAPGFWRANGMPFLVSLNDNLMAIWAAEVNGVSKVYYMFYDVINEKWSDIKNIQMDEGISSVMPFVQTHKNKAYVVFYGIGKQDEASKESEIIIYKAKIDELDKTGIAIGNKIAETSFKSKNSFLGDYIALSLFNQSNIEEGLLAYTTLVDNKYTYIVTRRIKF
ncbi:MAG: hypothetical protein Q8K70_05485 [Bacteroidota bacterium]|nr:hypothetical protein [Bacteroidota bacterium]